MTPVPASWSFSGSGCWANTDSCGQYLDVDWNTSNPADATGSVKLFRCPADRQSAAVAGGQMVYSSSYGLNLFMCYEEPQRWPYPAANLSSFRKATLAAVVTDVGGDWRWFPGNAGIPECQANANLSTTAVWEDMSVAPYLWVPRHSKGVNVGFLDGHVRSSPSLAVESAARTIYASYWSVP